MTIISYNCPLILVGKNHCLFTFFLPAPSRVRGPQLELKKHLENNGVCHFNTGLIESTQTYFKPVL